MNSHRKLEQKIDKHLQELVDCQLNTSPDPVVPEMAIPNTNSFDDWTTWMPIQSSITESDIQEFESTIGHFFPESYKRFLMHKHFYELRINECSFCKHPYGIWKDALNDMIFNGYPRQFLIDKGRIPFAVWSDWGLLCFDTTKEHEKFNYPIVLWDHEVAEAFKPMFNNFESMIFDLDKGDK